jgi:amino acid transporter
MTTASRLTWGFARDGGLPFSSYLSQVNNYWRVPVRVLFIQGIIVALIGVLYLFATTVLEAILSVSTIALTISYAMPIVTLLLVGRNKLPPGQFSLGRWGPMLNWVSIIYCLITTIFFFFPGSPDPSPSDMNYAIAVFGIMIIIALFSWFVQGRKTYLKTEEAMVEIFRAEQAEKNNQPHVEGILTTKLT